MRKISLLLALAALNLWACKKSSDSNGTNPTPASTTLSGTFEREIYSGTDSASTIRFIPNTDKTYSVKMIVMGSEYPFVSGTYSISGSQITFLSTICPSLEGKYNFTQTSSQINFTTVSDNCVSGKNRSFLISGNWAKK